MSKRYRFEMGAVLAVVLAAGGALAGDLTPPGPPGPTMHTLEDIYRAVTGDAGDAVAGEILVGKKAWVKGQNVTGTMPNVGQTNMTPGAAAQTIPQGHHDGTGEVAGDVDLAAENIKDGVTLFGVIGTHKGAALPKTGQTTSYGPRDDAELANGVAWPSPRFTDHDNGTVTDNLTGLMWVKAPHSLSGNAEGQSWYGALVFCNGLMVAEQAAWRLPNVRELQSLIDYGRSNPALPSGHPFTGVQADVYWTSSTAPQLTGSTKWTVSMYEGRVSKDDYIYEHYVWPVRSVQ